MSGAPDPLAGLLAAERLTAVVDIGANPIDGDPPYKKMLAKRLCRVVGFEPQAEALAALERQKSDLETYLPHAIGDGNDAVLRVCRAPGMTSLLEPEPRVLKLFAGFPEFGTVIKKIPVTTRRLDSIEEIADLDFLKIDVQGSELNIFRGGRSRLSRAVAIQTEVSFIPLYRDQPVFGDVDLELRGLGFVPHCFAGIKRWMILPGHHPKGPHVARNQVLESDIVYVRDFTRPDDMSAEQLKHLAMISHHCYRSHDLTMNCLQQLERRKAVAVGSLTNYAAVLKAGKP